MGRRVREKQARLTKSPHSDALEGHLAGQPSVPVGDERAPAPDGGSTGTTAHHFGRVAVYPSEMDRVPLSVAEVPPERQAAQGAESGVLGAPHVFPLT